MLSLVLAAAAAVATPATSCESLQSMATPQVAVTAQAMPAGPFVPPGAGPDGRAGHRARHPPRCRRTAA